MISQISTLAAMIITASATTLNALSIIANPPKGTSMRMFHYAYARIFRLFDICVAVATVVASFVLAVIPYAAGHLALAAQPRHRRLLQDRRSPRGLPPELRQPRPQPRFRIETGASRLVVRKKRRLLPIDRIEARQQMPHMRFD